MISGAKTISATFTKTKLIRAYYSHSRQIYNTAHERKERSYLQLYFPKIICPNHDLDLNPDQTLMYLRFVQWCDVLILSEYEDYIGLGVYTEAMEARKCGIPILCLREKRVGFDFFQVEKLELVDEYHDVAIGYATVETGDKVNITKFLENF